MPCPTGEMEFPQSKWTRVGPNQLGWVEDGNCIQRHTLPSFFGRKVLTHNRRSLISCTIKACKLLVLGLANLCPQLQLSQEMAREREMMHLAWFNLPKAVSSSPNMVLPDSMIDSKSADQAVCLSNGSRMSSCQVSRSHPNMTCTSAGVPSATSLASDRTGCLGMGSSLPTWG